MKNGFFAAGERLLTRLADQVEHHPKRITAVVAALLLGGGGGAFAVASMAPDAADLPVRQITETVQPISVTEQAEALDVHRFNLFRSDMVRPTDSVDTLLQRLGISDPVAAAFLRNDALVRISLLGRNGRQVTAEASEDHHLVRLVARWAPDDSNTFQRLVFEKTARGGYNSHIETAPLSASSKLAGGTIRSSLFAATDEAGLPAYTGETRVFFEFADHLGSANTVVDKRTGELVEKRTYTAYGSIESDHRQDRWGQFREDYGFTTKEEDVEVGLTYFGKRFYNPRLGRWLNADPLAVHSPGEADLNLYAYVSGRWFSSVDPLGLQPMPGTGTGPIQLPPPQALPPFLVPSFPPISAPPLVTPVPLPPPATPPLQFPPAAGPSFLTVLRVVGPAAAGFFTFTGIMLTPNTRIVSGAEEDRMVAADREREAKKRAEQVPVYQVGDLPKVPVYQAEELPKVGDVATGCFAGDVEVLLADNGFERIADGVDETSRALRASLFL